MDPPLGYREVAAVAKSVGKREYAYKCKDSPIEPLCEREVCLTREFGIGAKSAAGQKKESTWKVLQRLLEEAKGELWHTPDGRSFVSVTANGHREHMPTASTSLEQFMIHGYYTQKHNPISGEALKGAIAVWGALAIRGGQEYSVATRVAEHEGEVWLDL